MKESKSVASKAAQALSELGASKGGRARAKSLTKDQRKEIAQKAAEARWGESKIPSETHSGILKIGELEIPCSVLGDGTRVFSRSGFLKAIGRRGGAKSEGREASLSKMPVFLGASNLFPFISKGLIDDSTPLEYKTKKGTKAYGYKVTILPDVCNVFLDAKDKGVLRQGQMHIAERCKILLKGFSTVGVVALVDEATGYQEVRDRMALQAILDAFLRKELAAWASRFPNDFYSELFRLRGWNWEIKSGHRPRQAGKDTKNIVYARLAPGILEELEKKNPPNENWHRKARHHQWLTEDIGHPALAQHLHAVMALMRISKDWDQFKRMLDEAFPKRGDTLKLPFMTESTS